MKTHHCIQGSAEWWELHRGIPTASSFDRIITPKKAQISAQADDLIAELIAHRFMDSIAPEGYTSDAMLKGIQLEPEARRWYEFEHGVEVQQVGICISDCGRYGASPDALVGEDGGLELKCPLPKTHVKYLLAGTLPDEYRAQVHGELLVTGRAWFDFVSYCPPMPPLTVRVVPGEFTMQLAKALDQFWERYQEALAKIGEHDGRESQTKAG